jgi:hypothetical protein
MCGNARQLSFLFCIIQ